MTIALNRFPQRLAERGAPGTGNGTGNGGGDGGGPGPPWPAPAATAGQPAVATATGAFDCQLLKASFARLARQSDQVMAHFFATLFLHNPELRALFPLAMDCQRRRLFAALARYVRDCEHPQTLMPWLSQLARDHRTYGVSEEHYQPFCAALLETIATFSGGDWTPEVRDGWESALGYISSVMADAGREAAGQPAWWVAEVTAHELRRPDLAVLTIRPDPALPYLPGQHVSVQVPRWPRVWREYSVANAPARDGSLRLHVRAVPGGMVSSALVRQTRPGDALIVGRARGAMTADAVQGTNVLCVAGGTGLAPVKAIVEALTRPGRGRPVPCIGILVGARDAGDLYDLPDLRRIERECASVHVTPVVAAGPGGAARGTLPEATAWHLSPGTADVVISGPPAMITRTATVVAAHAPGARIHLDPPQTDVVPATSGRETRSPL